MLQVCAALSPGRRGVKFPMLNFGKRGSGVNPKNFRNDKENIDCRLKLAGRKYAPGWRLFLP